MPYSKRRITMLLVFGFMVIFCTSAFAYLPDTREEAVKMLNERGDFEVLLYEDVPADTAISIMAGIPYKWLEKLKVKRPLRVENPPWSRPIKSNTIGQSNFKMGVQYRAYLLGDTIIFLGK